jgi:hypothetical protein
MTEMTPEQRRDYERARAAAEALGRRWKLEYLKQSLPLPLYILWMLVSTMWMWVLPSWGLIALFRGVIFPN